MLDSPAEASAFEGVPGVRNVVLRDNHVEMSFEGEMGALLKAATDRFGVVDIRTTEADLEEIFLTYYHADERE